RHLALVPIFTAVRVVSRFESRRIAVARVVVDGDVLHRFGWCAPAHEAAATMSRNGSCGLCALSRRPKAATSVPTPDFQTMATNQVDLAMFHATGLRRRTQFC